MGILFFILCKKIKMLSENKNHEKISRSISICSIIFCIIGIISNLISIAVCLKKELIKLPTFVFLAFLSLMNILKLVSVGLSVYLLEFFIESIQEVDKSTLSISMLLLLWEYQSTAYLKVSHCITLLFEIDN